MRQAGETGPADVHHRSAAERFRARWESRLAWSTGIAVVIHVAAFAFSPTWRASLLFIEEPDEWEGTELLVLPFFGEAATPGDALRAAPAPASIVEDEEDEEDDPGNAEGSASTDSESDEVWRALGDRLQRGGGLLATVTLPESEPESVEDEADDDGAGASEEEEDPDIAGAAALADLATLPEPDSLSLDRLSALRPQLAFMSASAWVLIRNQQEVETFLRRGYLEGGLDPSASGSVSVTLWIDQRGSVEWAEISHSSGHRELDEFALALFNEVADFRAAREQGMYVSRSVTFSLNFPW